MSRNKIILWGTIIDFQKITCSIISMLRMPKRKNCPYFFDFQLNLGYGEGVQIKSITDTQGRLYGGSMAITLSAKRLIGTGLKKEMVMKCVSKNPLSYLKE